MKKTFAGAFALACTITMNCLSMENEEIIWGIVPNNPTEKKQNVPRILQWTDESGNVVGFFYTDSDKPDDKLNISDLKPITSNKQWAKLEELYSGKNV